MKRGIYAIWVLVLMLVLLAGSTSASINYYNNTILSSYQGGDSVSGKINISISNESTNSSFTSSLGGEINILSLLKNNSLVAGQNFTCDPSNCLSGYSKTTSISQFTLNGKKIIGFSVSGNDISIESIKFNIQNNLSAACFNQIYVNFLDNQSYYIPNNARTNNVCSSPKNYGCFVESGSDSAIIEDLGVCENITLSSAPAHKVGAEIINSTTGSSELKMQITDFDGNVKGECTLSNMTQGTEEKECIIDFATPVQANYNVCIIPSSSTPNYKIRTEANSPVCGTNSRDYKIFARPMEYAGANISMNDSIFENLYGLTLADAANAYLNKNYKVGNKVVCDNGCVIPLAISGNNQVININNAEIVYTSTGTPISSNSVYSINVTNPTLSMNASLLEISYGKFIVPGSTSSLVKSMVFKLLFAGNEILSKSINISPGGFLFDVNPKFALIGQNTEFVAGITGNVTSVWNFGDDSESVSSNNNKSTHRYLESGSYDLEVTITKNGSSSTKKFNITVGNAKDSANITLIEYEKRIKNITAQVNAYPLWIKNELNKNINVSLINASLVDLRKDFNNATNESQYVDIVNALIELDVPRSIGKTISGNNAPLIIGADNFNVNYLAEITNASVDSENEGKLKDSIISWIENNYDAFANFEVISKVTDSGQTPMFTKFKITLNSKSSNTSDSYLIIGYPLDSIIFSESYSQQGVNEGAATYIPVSGSKNVEFILPTQVEVSELGAYVSPEVRELGTFGPITDIEKPKFNWMWFWIWLAILVVVFLIIYIILQEWYKKNYENHLFKTRNDLFNLINFIYNSRLNGMKDEDIKKKLKEAGWNAEQISYAFKKIDGKRTGMWEIPLLRHSENKTLRKEIGARHPEGIDTRFINRPNY